MGAGQRMQGKRGCVDDGADLGGAREVGQVAGEAVAEIDGGADAELTKRAAGGETRLGKALRASGARERRRTGEHALELGSGTAESAGDKEAVAGACLTAAHRSAARRVTDEDDIGGEMWAGIAGLRWCGQGAGVAAGERDRGTAGEGSHAAEEALEPATVGCETQGLWWKGQGEKGGERCRAHCGEIAEATSKAAMTDGGSGVQVTAEVPALEQQIGGDEEVASGRGREDGAVVADPLGDTGGGDAGEVAVDRVDQRKLAGKRL